MKAKTLAKAVEVAANIIIVGSAAKSLFNKFVDPVDDDEDDEDDDDEYDDNEEV